MEMSLPDASIFGNEPIRRMTRAEYHRLGDAGFFGEEKVELLFGVVVEMTPIDQAHVHSTYVLRRMLEHALGDRATVYSPSVLAASDISEPEPDVFVVPGGQYWKAHPERAHLVVEVARSSLRDDRIVKALLYGLSSVDEYWIVAVDEGFVEVYREPHAGGWQSKSTYQRGDVLSMAAFPDVRIAVSDLLPPIE